MAFDITLHFPERAHPTGKGAVRRGVASFELEFGAENTVHIEYADGRTEEVTANGLTVTAGDIHIEEAD